MEHKPAEEVNPAEEILTVDKLYWRLGHISPKSAQKLVKDGFVTALKLKPTSDANIFCEACILVFTLPQDTFERVENVATEHPPVRLADPSKGWGYDCWIM